MMVCQCHRVSDRTITGLMAEGCADVEEVGRLCGAGTGCGGCRATLEALLDQVACRAGAAEQAPAA